MAMAGGTTIHEDRLHAAGKLLDGDGRKLADKVVKFVLTELRHLRMCLGGRWRCVWAGDVESALQAFQARVMRIYRASRG